MKNALGLAIFRAGTHTSTDGRTIEFSDADIAEIAANYDPQLAEAPLVVGHPKLDAPAYGWARSLRADGSLLYAEPHQVEAQFAELVNTGRIKKISASVYLRDSPGNPTPGKLYLRHIGFLGAQPPSVKGLPNAQFAEGDGAVEFAMPSAIGNVLVDVLQRVRDWFVETQGVDKADQIIPQWQIRSLDELASRGDDLSLPAYAERDAGTTTLEIEMSDKDKSAEFAEREQGLNTRQTELEARERAVKDRETAARRTDAATFADGLVTEGKLLPRHKAPVVELLMALAPGAALEFAEGDATVSKPGADVLRELLTSLPRQVDYAEKSGADHVTAAVSFAAPAGTVVDAAASETFARAKAYQAEHPNVDWLACVRAVAG